MIPVEAVEAAAKGIFDVRDDPYDLDEWEDLDSTAREPYVCNARAALEAAAPYMLSQRETKDDELAAEYRRGYRDGLADRKQVTASPRDWEPGDPIE